ncbi:MAG: hypothetical protein K2M64_02330, partial [Clostridia bacterium]|nr:hypothetical protein [Clostridia bacterium]
YNGLVSNCRLVINKKVNTWLTALDDLYNGNGNVDMEEFAIPVAANQNDLLRFNVVKADGSIIGTGLVLGEGNANETNTFLAILKTLANGTYTVTAYIGGTAGYNYDSLDDTNPLKIALDKYNADYNMLTSVCTINLTPHTNGWNTTLSGQSWTWGEFDATKFTMPQSSHGNDKIVFSVRDESDGFTKTFDASLYNYNPETNKTPAQIVYELFIDYISKLDAGTYSVTVSVTGTDIYYSPETLTAVFVVSPVTTKWNIDDDELAKYEYITGTWGSFTGTELPNLEVANWDNAVIVYKMDDTTVTGEYNNPWKNAFAMLPKAGVYTFTATVTGDDNHTDLTFRVRVTANKITSSWNTTTDDKNGTQYNWIFAGESNDVIDEPVIGTAAGNDVIYTISKRGATGALTPVIFNETDTQTSDWSTVISTLQAQPSGEYIITAKVDGDDNHTSLDYSVTVVVSLATNGWKKHIGTDTVEWTFGATDNPPIVYEANYNNEFLEFTVDGGKVADLAAALATLGAGEHSIVASVKADEKYGAISETVKLIIKKASNDWLQELVIEDWTWNDISKYDMTIDFTAPVPAQGATSIVTVRNSDNDIVLEATLNYDVDGNGKKNVIADVYNAFVRKLCALDVGTYTISVVVNETENHASIAVKDVEFNVKQATNSWPTSADEPTIAGWAFGGSTAYPSANPLFGKNTVQFSYSKVSESELLSDVIKPIGEHEWTAAPDYTAGKYWLRAYVPGTDNYSELYGYHKFSINEAENAWVKMPGVVEWSWNGYDKDINLFSGSARSNKPAVFSISKADGSMLTVSDFYAFGGKIVLGDGIEILVNSSTIGTIRSYLNGFTLDNDGKVSDAVENILNALKNGKYRLTVEVDGGESLQAISGYTDFTVDKADNEWITAPNVLSYDYNGFVASGEWASFTAGESKYGTITYAVVLGAKYLSLDGNGKVTQSDSLTTLNSTQVAELLPKLNAGNYTLRAWVVAGDTYEAFYSSTGSYPVLFGVSRIENEWATELQNSVEVYYAVLNAKNDNGDYTFDFEAWFIEQATKYNDVIAYTLLNTNYSPAISEEGKPTVAKVFTYQQLFEAIRSLPSGDYVIHMTVTDDESGNYLAMSADTSLTIKRYANSFTEFPDQNLTGQWQLSGKWKPTDNVNATTLDDFTVAVEYGTITYTINSVKCETVAKLKEEVAKLNAGSYQVVIAVEQSNEYEGISHTVQLDIKQGSNVLDWSIDESWTWEDGNKHFNADYPKYGKQITVEITESTSSTASYITIDFSVDKPLDIINQVIGLLNAGTYTIKVTAAADDNWAEKTSEPITFVIERTLNAWEKDGVPMLNGNFDVESNLYLYEYGNTVAPSATPQHGTVKYTYYKKTAGGNYTKLTSTPKDVGEYYVEISVDATTNHAGIDATTLYFKINKALENNFIVFPTAVGWTWGDYNRLVHMFKGIPTSGGKVSYTILDEDKAIVAVNDIALDKIYLVDKDGGRHDDFGMDLYVPEEAIVNGQIVRFADLIKLLKEGNYYLQINVDETDNNIAFTNSDARFRVDSATNGWNVTPKIASWAVGEWSNKENMPKAEPKFGYPTVLVTSQNNNEVYYRSVYNPATGQYDVLNRLENALAGWYTMTVTVEALEYCYTGLEETVEVQVYMRGTTEKDKNSWYELPGIDSWEAIIDGVGNVPYGTPLRGLPYFEFYFAKRNADNQLVIDWKNPVVEGEDSYLVSMYDSNGNRKYYKDFYMPMAPGYYFMVACAANVNEEGKVIAEDNLYESKTPYPLHIENRINTFENDPHIDTLLFLGDRDNWAQPTVKASLPDSEFWFTYIDLKTGEDLGRTMPTTEGEYRVIAHILARYSEEKTKWADFTVKKSTNSWIEEPTIEDWSEEFGEKDPIASALYDGEVFYTYENLETHEKFTQKPTTEGTYKMTVTVKTPGYEDLVGTTTFTIDPAYDRDLLTIDIILGCVACALAVFVIYFAIRRYREN